MTPSDVVVRREQDELPALVRLTFQELGHAAGGIGAVHRAIADRAFGASGAGATPARAVHDGVSAAVYGTLRGGAQLTGAAASALAGRRVADPQAVSSHPRGAAVLAAINGLIGDVLERDESPLAQPMAVRVGGGVVAPSPDELAAAFPGATPRIVVFLHGLMETELAWHYGGEAPYGARLAEELGTTAVDVRYNTGRHISENGESLSELLEELVAAWPCEVEQVALVGHSMGGLVARSACHHGAAAELAWTRKVRHVVSLGSPHLGAPLEQAVHAASAALHALPETRPLGRFLRRRSSGIRDLHQGSLVDTDWRDADPDALRKAACQEVPLLDGAMHCFVSATVTRSPRHPVGRVLGDYLVLQGSASGRGRTRSIPFPEEHGHHVGGAHHLALLNHPEVYGKLKGWLEA